MDDIDSTPAGPEMDALVAERVMGYGVVRFDYYGMEGTGPAKKCMVWVTDPTRVEEPALARLDVTINPIPFSTDIAAAWQLVEAIRNRPDWAVEFSGASDWQVIFVECFPNGRTKAHFAMGKDLPVAICRAALKAVGVGHDKA